MLQYSACQRNWIKGIKWITDKCLFFKDTLAYFLVRLVIMLDTNVYQINDLRYIIHFNKEQSFIPHSEQDLLQRNSPSRSARWPSPLQLGISHYCRHAANRQAPEFLWSHPLGPCRWCRLLPGGSHQEQSGGGCWTGPDCPSSSCAALPCCPSCLWLLWSWSQWSVWIKYLVVWNPVC